MKKYILFLTAISFSVPAFAQGGGKVIKKILTTAGEAHVEKTAAKTLTKANPAASLPAKVITPKPVVYKEVKSVIVWPMQHNYVTPLGKKILPRVRVNKELYEYFKNEIRVAFTQLISEEAAAEVDAVIFKMEKAYPGDVFTELIKAERKRIVIPAAGELEPDDLPDYYFQKQGLRPLPLKPGNVQEVIFHNPRISYEKLAAFFGRSAPVMRTYLERRPYIKRGEQEKGNAEFTLAAVAEYVRNNPHDDMQMIADYFGVTPSKVSILIKDNPKVINYKYKDNKGRSRSGNAWWD